jgi:hypothetical protein
VTTDVGGGADRAQGLAVQADGGLVVAGSADDPGFGSDFALGRTGDRERTWGSDTVALDGGRATGSPS